MKTRPRINRWTEARRNLLFGDFSLQSLVQPHFVVNGSGIDNPIEGMDGIHQQSVDILIQTIRNDYNNGIRSVMLFGIVNSEDKDEQATKASNTINYIR